MSLKFTLVENRLTDDPEDYFAKVQGVETLDVDTLIKHMTLPGALTATHAKAVLTEYHYQLVHLLGMGFAINDGLVRYRPSIRGSFITEEDSFDPERHQKTVKISPTPLLKNSVSDMDITRVDPILVESQIRSFHDLIDEVKNDTFRPDNLAMVKGRHLEFDKTDEAQGVFFINEAGEEFRCNRYGVIKPSQVFFSIPTDIVPGLYDLEVRSHPDHLNSAREAKLRRYVRCIPK